MAINGAATVSASRGSERERDTETETEAEKETGAKRAQMQGWTDVQTCRVHPDRFSKASSEWVDEDL